MRMPRSVKSKQRKGITSFHEKGIYVIFDPLPPCSPTFAERLSATVAPSEILDSDRDDVLRFVNPCALVPMLEMNLRKALQRRLTKSLKLEEAAATAELKEKKKNFVRDWISLVAKDRNGSPTFATFGVYLHPHRLTRQAALRTLSDSFRNLVLPIAVIGDFNAVRDRDNNDKSSRVPNSSSCNDFNQSIADNNLSIVDDPQRHFTWSNNRKNSAAILCKLDWAMVNAAWADSAPRPDGFSAYFYQRYWHIVGDDVIRVIKGSFETGRLVKRINKSILVLISKHQGSCSPQDLRPIISLEGAQSSVGDLAREWNKSCSTAVGTPVGHEEADHVLRGRGWSRGGKWHKAERRRREENQKSVGWKKLEMKVWIDDSDGE
ncbi:hypothetical protein EJ110_NYTH27502 [Nymphaea thermarum]|nr:hypothetical protein EJ110_NYTH27502 [Nymphaea thermarum]